VGTGSRIAPTHAEQIEEFRDAVEAKVDDPELRHELSDIITGFAEQQQELAREARGVEEAELALQMSRLDVQSQLHQGAVLRLVDDDHRVILGIVERPVPQFLDRG
jgi:hypothetical protein